MSRLSSYNKSPIWNIAIRYGEELVTFNLAKELKIDTDIINDELKKQPSHYGFCLLIHKKLVTRFETLKMRRKKIYGSLFLRAKERKLNGRPLSDDNAKHYVESHPKFINISKDCIKAKDDADQLFSCIKAFEQRKDILQSMSSNFRNNL